MKRALLLGVAVLGLSACNVLDGTQPLPDGGRARIVCANGFTVLPVTVVDSSGKPIDGAAVTATNNSNGKAASGTTNGNGVTTAVDETLGSGVVRITAEKAGQKSAPFDATFSCGECDCYVTPRSATLMINVAQ